MAITEEDLATRIQGTPKPLIALKIKQARKDLGLSHDAFGQLLGGVTRQHLIKLEKGEHRPRPPMLARIAAAVDKPVDWFLEPEVAPARPFPGGADHGDS